MVNRISQHAAVIAVSVMFILLFLGASNVWGQTTTSTWALTSNANAVISGNISSGAMSIGSGISNLTFSGTGANSTNWESGTGINLNDYYEFTISPLSGNILTIDDIQFNHERSKDNGANNGGPTVGSVYYSTNGFSSSIQIGSNFTVNTGSTSFSASGLSISVPEGSTLTLRIYGWSSENSNGRYSILSLILSGTTVLAAPPSCTTSISPSSGEVGFAVDGTMNWNAASGATGYYMYFGTDAGATNIENGTDLGNVTSYTPSSNLDFLTDYYWKVVPYNSFGIASGCSIWSYTTSDISYCTAGSTAYDLYESITNVTFAGIDNTSPVSKTTGYADYTSLVSPGNVSPGQNYQVSISNEFLIEEGYGGYCKVYIDLDQNGDFDSSSELMFGSAYINNTTMTGTISIPATAVQGLTRMRIVIEGDANSSGALPCGNFTWGEVEDYAINIASPCTGAEVPVLTAGSTNVCPESDVTINISGTLNDATEWIIYTGSCGGTQIGTTSSGSFIVNSISSTTTYYIRGEGSLCDDPTCGSITITVEDITVPVEDVATLSDITAECEVTSLTPPTATDNCEGTITGTHNAILPITTQGTTVITWTYDDGNGNTSTQTQNVVIDDVTAPTITCPSDINQSVDAGLCTASGISLGTPSAGDNCSVVSFTNDAPVTFPVGTTVVGWTVTDIAGNTAACPQNVVIVPEEDIDISIVALADFCQSGQNGTTTVIWTVNLLAGTTDWTYDYTINDGSTDVATDTNVSATGNTTISYTMNNSDSDKTYTLTITNVKDDCGISETGTTIHSEEVTVSAVPTTGEIIPD